MAAWALLIGLAAGAARADGQDDRAAREARVAQQLRDHQAKGMIQRGKQLLAEGSYAEARDAFRRALKYRPDDPAATKLLAETELALGSANAMGSLRDRQAFRAEQLVRQAEMELFDARKALEKKNYAEAIAKADRVLANARYIQQPDRARALRQQAGKVLELARPAQKAQAMAKREEELKLAKAEAEAHRFESQGEMIRELRDRGWKHLRAGRTDDALATASRMLAIAPGNRDAILLQEEARLAGLGERPTLAGTPKKVRESADSLLDEAVRELKIEEDIQNKVVVAGEKERAAVRALDRPMEAWEREARAALDEEVTLGFDGVPLHEAVATIRKLSKLNIIIDPSVETRDVPITIDRSTMPLGSVLGWVARLGELEYTLRHGAVLVTTPTGMLRGPVQRIYDVSTFIAPVEDSSPLSGVLPLEPFASTAESGAPEDVDPELIGRGWADFIRTTIAQDTWRQEGMPQVKQEEQPHYSISYRNGRIVVVHTPEVHEEIEDLLNNFRKARNLQVHILARFLEITKRYLDEMNVSVLYDSGVQRSAYDPAVPTPFGTLAEEPKGDKRYRAQGDITPDHNVGDLSRFGGFTNSGGLTGVYTWESSDGQFLQIVLESVLKGGKGSLLSAPRLTCFNTQRANLQVLTNYNYVRRVSTDNEPEIGNIPEGIVFDVQPFVSADRRYITLVLQPQMRELVELIEYNYSTEPQTIDQGNFAVSIFQESYIQIPTTRLRSMGTTVTVPNGGTLLLGGFDEVEEQAGSSNVPFLEGIPVIRTILRGWRRNEGRRAFIMLVTAQTVPDLFEE
jgi:tetratricopeptide (TPR) repeat protein